MSTSLRDLQMQLLQSIVAGNDTALSQIVDRGAAAQNRLKVYQDAYLLRIAEAMRADYRALHLLLGDALFHELCSDYIRRHPSSRPSIRWAGRHLPKFMAQHPHYAKLPAVADLALFEWQKSEVFDEKDEAILSFETLSKFAQAGEIPRFSRIRASRLVQIDDAVPALWQRLIDGHEVAKPELGEKTDWLLWRQNNTVHWRSLPSTEANLLKALDSSFDLSSICEQLANDQPHDQVPFLATHQLRQWCEEGLLRHVKKPSQSDKATQGDHL